MITKEKVDSALQCLIDNGIDEDEAETVLQAIAYILCDEEIEKPVRLINRLSIS